MGDNTDAKLNTEIDNDAKALKPSTKRDDSGFKFDPSADCRKIKESDFQTHIDELHKLKQAALAKPLQIGHSFDFTIPQSDDAGVQLQPGKVGSRPLPPFAHSAGAPLTVRLERFLGGTRGIIWQCTVENNTSKLAPKFNRVVAKFIQPSMLYIPSSPSFFARQGYYSQEELVASEQSAYKRLKSLQGRCIPRFYGAHKVSMPNGEEATMFVIEYIDGITATTFQEQCPGPSGDHVDHEKYFLKAKAGVIAAQRSLSEIHELGVLHQDMHGGNIILQSTGSDTDAEISAVFIDFGNCKCYTEGSVVDNLQVGEGHWLWSEVASATSRISACCYDHMHAVSDWIKIGGPGICVGYLVIVHEKPSLDAKLVLPLGVKDTRAHFSVGVSGTTTVVATSGCTQLNQI
ncbi:hypothetical protein OF83DRAFT_1179502 [Amylostereum chailletii]|nr:hypothetical protein OF83DRAFT_1179502 [Amylostereum chailletii]